MYELKKKVLMALIDYGVATSDVLKSIDDRTEHLKKLLTELTKDGYISNRKVTYKEGHRKYSVSYKAITGKGVQWVVENCSDEYEWLRYLPQPIPRFSHTKSFASENKNRELRGISVSILFEMLGITIKKPETMGSKRKLKSVSFTDMVEEAKATCAVLECNDSCETDKVYYASKSLKRYFVNDEDEITQYNFFSHLGLLNYKGDVYLVYATKPKGLIFNKGVVERTNSVGSAFLGITSGWKFFNGLVFCKNSSDFAKTFNKNYEFFLNKWNDKKHGHTLSELFGQICAVPVSRDGVNMLKQILTRGEQLHDEVAEMLIRSDSSFSKTYDWVTEMKYMEHEVYIGIDMQMNTLQRFKYRVETSTDNEQYIVVCYKWQEGYYRKVLPDNIYYYHVDV